MRWTFMLLVVLNLFYYVWHLQSVTALPKQAESPVLARALKQNIQLLSESEDALAPVVAPLPAKGQDVCLFLGGNARRDLVEQLRQRALSLGVTGDILEESVASDTDYWVYLAPLASRDASVRQLRELQARQIESYLIAEGDLANGISLGMFARRQAAEAAVQKVRQAGYEPALRELPRARNAYWVKIMPAERRLIGPEVIQQLSATFPGLQHRIEGCESIATHNSFD